MHEESIGQLETHRAVLTGHCYRMLGSPVDADDAVQETMIRALRAYGRFDGRSSLRTWLCRIATNVCLDALNERTRRVRPMEERGPGTIDDELVARPRTHWIEPIADARAIPADAVPSEQLIMRQSIRLAFVAALQHLPPRQRAALLLSEVLGCSAQEVAETLDMTVPAVNSALQRARATLSAGALEAKEPALTPAQTKLLERYVSAFERYDVDELATLLRDDVVFSMPPFDLWLEGPEPVRHWMLGRGAACRGSKLVPIAASASPSYAHYKPIEGGGYQAWALVVLELSGERIGAWTSFLDVEYLFPYFELPMRID